VESISEYVEQRAALLTLEHLDELRADLPLLNVRFAAIAVPQFPHLQQQLQLLGYADDSLIVRTVLSRHQDVFRAYCRFRKIRWSKISFAALLWDLLVVHVIFLLLRTHRKGD
jgi:hypothetical protein